MRLKIEMNGDAIIDCDVMMILQHLGFKNGPLLTIKPGTNITITASNKSMVIQDNLIQPAQVWGGYHWGGGKRICHDCGHEVYAFEEGLICSSCGGCDEVE